jgi:P pilus assembly chaperone PapD
MTAGPGERAAAPAPPRVAIEPTRLTLAPGSAAEVQVSVRNASRTIEFYRTTLVGLPSDDLYRCDPPLVKLRPGESGTTTVRITLPERSGLDAGQYTFGVLVRSPHQDTMSRCEELRVDVQPVPLLTMTASPEVVSGGPAAAYTIKLANDGNSPLSAELTGRDQEDKVAFAFRPAAVQLDPGGRAEVQLVVRAAAPWTGREVRRALTVRAAGPDVSAGRDLTFLQRPRVPGGPLRVAGIAAAVAVLAAAPIAGGAIAKQKDRQEAARKAEQNIPATAPAVPGPASAPAVTGPASAGAVTGPAATTAAATVAASTAPSAASTGLPGRPKIIDFTQRPGGLPAGDGIISGDLYAAAGVTLSSITENAPPQCADATAVALRTVGGLGSFVTSARPAGADLCNTMPVRLTLGAPARAVRLAFGGDGAMYGMSAELTDGSLAPVTATSKKGAVTTIGYDAPSGGVSVVAVIFGHADPNPLSKDPTIIKRLTYAPA